jgi:hypothetical protein
MLALYVKLQPWSLIGGIGGAALVFVAGIVACAHMFSYQHRSFRMIMTFYLKP